MCTVSLGACMELRVFAMDLFIAFYVLWWALTDNSKRYAISLGGTESDYLLPKPCRLEQGRRALTETERAAQSRGHPDRAKVLYCRSSQNFRTG